MLEYPFEPKHLKFNSARDDNYHLWTMCVEAALRSGELATTLSDDRATTIISERPLAIIMNGSKDIPLRAI